MNKPSTDLSRRAVLGSMAAGTLISAATPQSIAALASTKVKEKKMSAMQYRTQKVGKTEIFYRETGLPDAPVLLLLHGFPTSSHMFRDLMPALTDRYRVIAPDLPGFGLTKALPRGEFVYSFETLPKLLTSSSRQSAFAVLHFMFLIMVLQSVSGLHSKILNESRQSSLKTATLIQKGLVPTGNPGKLTGAIRRLRTAKLRVLLSQMKQYGSSMSMGRRQGQYHRTHICSTRFTCSDLELTKFNWT